MGIGVAVAFGFDGRVLGFGVVGSAGAASSGGSADLGAAGTFTFGVAGASPGALAGVGGGGGTPCCASRLAVRRTAPSGESERSLSICVKVGTSGRAANLLQEPRRQRKARLRPTQGKCERSRKFMHLHHLPPGPRTWAEIDPAALLHNARTLREHVCGEPARDVGIIAVVKADAYGHGLPHVVPVLAQIVERFGVANLAEALLVRALAPAQPILLLSPAAPDERAEILANGFVPMVSSSDEAAAYSQLSRQGRSAIHLKLDTGMGRMGLWHEEAVTVVREIRALHGVEITGIATHLPSADEDDAYTREQLELFGGIVRTLQEEEGLGHARVHALNSAGAIAFPEHAGDFIRAGLALYGSSPRPEFQAKLQPALTWKTLVTLVREVPAGRTVSYGRTFTTRRRSRLATLAVGYADGFRRTLSGRDAEVLIRGRRCPVVGRVTMDQVVVDATSVEDLEAGEEVVLLGRQDGEEISARELADKAGTIAWEIFTGLGNRVLRKVI
jgi:alanine racemase